MLLIKWVLDCHSMSVKWSKYLISCHLSVHNIFLYTWGWFSHLEMFLLPVPLRCTRLAEKLSRRDRKRCKHWFVEATSMLNHWLFLNSCLVKAPSGVQECNVFSRGCLSFCLSVGRILVTTYGPIGTFHLGLLSPGPHLLTKRGLPLVLTSPDLFKLVHYVAHTSVIMLNLSFFYIILLEIGKYDEACACDRQNKSSLQ